MSSRKTAKPRSMRLTARSRFSLCSTAWHSNAKLPTFMRRESSPKNSSSSSRATASHTAANDSAVTREWGTDSSSAGSPAACSTRVRCAPDSFATAAFTK